ncbi:frataxin, mitochondrial-like [Ylistrum balloti]|uniref:frataxin, mitochondrial-like n=1 Tax=Ylistrum balloti TaxID=509963 RepID=UPI0029059C00|nr:frataxin, mitochondrial-like [Ylistrum balloti]
MSGSSVLSLLRYSSRNWTRKLYQRISLNVISRSVCEKRPFWNCMPNISCHQHSFTNRPASIDPCRNYCTSSLSEMRYEELAEEVLECLSEKFDDIAETVVCDEEFDVSYGSGVLTVKISRDWGTYVINKQTPNKQIWLSSPVSGPKRYDYIDGRWIYKHDGVAMMDLLTKEVSDALSTHIDFTACELEDT